VGWAYRAVTIEIPPADRLLIAVNEKLAIVASFIFIKASNIENKEHVEAGYT
jgi:hypothetical protein